MSDLTPRQKRHLLIRRADERAKQRLLKKYPKLYKTLQNEERERLGLGDVQEKN